MINITLTPDIERALTEEAARQETTPEILALECLRERFVAPPANDLVADDQISLADFLADYIGVLSSGEYIPGGAEMSDDSGRKFAAGLVKKRQEHHL